jgi:hypothetical protein
VAGARVPRATVSTRAASQRGRDVEVLVAQRLQADGWLVASRRHVGGAGDLLAVRIGHRPLLIEVKSRLNVWEGFRRADRLALVRVAGLFNCSPLLCSWPPGQAEPDWLGPDEWPK